MSTAEKEAVLVALASARSQLEALALRVLAASGDVAAAHGAKDPGVWLAHATGSTRATASRELRLGRALEAHQAVAVALAEGVLRTEQAEVIVAAVDALPSHVTAEVRADAVEALLGFAGRHDAKELRRIGKRILDVVAPEVRESQ